MNKSAMILSAFENRQPKTGLV